MDMLSSDDCNFFFLGALGLTFFLGARFFFVAASLYIFLIVFLTAGFLVAGLAAVSTTFFLAAGFFLCFSSFSY